MLLDKIGRLLWKGRKFLRNSLARRRDHRSGQRSSRPGALRLFARAFLGYDAGNSHRSRGALTPLGRALLGVSAALFFLLAGTAGSGEKAAGEPLATVRKYHGQVRVLRPGDSDWRGVRPGEVFWGGERLKTGEGAWVYLSTPEGEIKVGAETELVLRREPGKLPGGAGNKKSGVTMQRLYLDLGRIWLYLIKKSGVIHFEVETPAAIAGVRGTTFSVAAFTDGTTRVSVLEGEVEVLSLQPEVEIPLLPVKAGEQAEIRQRVGEKGPMPKEELELWQEQLPWLKEVGFKKHSGQNEEEKPAADGSAKQREKDSEDDDTGETREIIRKNLEDAVEKIQEYTRPDAGTPNGDQDGIKKEMDEAKTDLEEAISNLEELLPRFSSEGNSESLKPEEPEGGSGIAPEQVPSGGNDDGAVDGKPSGEIKKLGETDDIYTEEQGLPLPDPQVPSPADDPGKPGAEGAGWPPLSLPDKRAGLGTGHK